MDLKNKQTVADAVQRVLAGDVDAYELIYSITDRPLRAFIGSRYGRYGSDFIKEVALRTHGDTCTRLDKYNPDKGASFQTWLNWRSLNVAREVMAERFPARVVSVDVDRLDSLVSSAPDPAATSEAARRNRALWQAYENLAGDGRLSIALHDLDGRTLPDTAQRVGLSVGKVRYKRDRVLAVLKQRLQEQGVSGTERDSTPMPDWYSPGDLGHDEDWTMTVTESPVGEDGKEVPEE